MNVTRTETLPVTSNQHNYGDRVSRDYCTFQLLSPQNLHKLITLQTVPGMNITTTETDIVVSLCQRVCQFCMTYNPLRL